MKKNKMQPKIEVSLYKYNRNIGDTYLIYVYHIPKKKWYSVTIDGNEETVKVTLLPMATPPPKQYLKRK